MIYHSGTRGTVLHQDLFLKGLIVSLDRVLHLRHGHSHVRTRFVELHHSVLALPRNFVRSSETERVFQISPVT